MSLLKCCYQNILEDGTVSFAGGGAQAAYPLYRIYDRDIGKMMIAADDIIQQIDID